MWSYFFFQAEDGIRDGHVTGVQTCALPISVIVQPIVNLDEFLLGAANLGLGAQVFSHEAEQRSEERRVGKECRARWGAEEWTGKELVAYGGVRVGRLAP